MELLDLATSVDLKNFIIEYTGLQRLKSISVEPDTGVVKLNMNDVEFLDKLHLDNYRLKLKELGFSGISTRNPFGQQTYTQTRKDWYGNKTVTTTYYVHQFICKVVKLNILEQKYTDYTAEIARKKAEKEAAWEKEVSDADTSSFKLTDRDFLKMLEYMNKGTKPDRVADPIKDTNKVISRYVIAKLLEWDRCARALKYRAEELGLTDAQLEQFFRKVVNSKDPVASKYVDLSKFSAPAIQPKVQPEQKVEPQVKQSEPHEYIDPDMDPDDYIIDESLRILREQEEKEKKEDEDNELMPPPLNIPTTTLGRDSERLREIVNKNEEELTKEDEMFLKRFGLMQ